MTLKKCWDSLQTTLCVRFWSEVIACGVVYAAARRFQIPLPKNPPWWLVFDADQNGIEEVCRVLAHLYTLPKAQYIPVYKDKKDSFTSINKTPESQVPKESSVSGAAEVEDNLDGDSSKDANIKLGLDKLKELKKNEDESKSDHADLELNEDSSAKPVTESSRDRARERLKAKEQVARGETMIGRVEEKTLTGSGRKS